VRIAREPLVDKEKNIQEVGQNQHPTKRRIFTQEDQDLSRAITTN